MLENARVPSGPIYSVADMFEDPHYRARGLLETVRVGDEELMIPALVPRLSDTPGGTRWPGPEVGAHNRSVYQDLLGLQDEELEQLAGSGII